MAKIKEVSSYNGTSWDTPVPIGANDANIDITSSTTNPTDTTATSAGLVDSNVTVAAGDTAASAWTKFNRFRKRVQNAFGNFAGVTLRTAYNTSNTSTSVYTTGVINNYMSNVIGYTGTTAPSAGTVAAQLSSLNSNAQKITSYELFIHSGTTAQELGRAIMLIYGKLFLLHGIVTVTTALSQETVIYDLPSYNYGLANINNNPIIAADNSSYTTVGVDNTNKTLKVTYNGGMQTGKFEMFLMGWIN